LEFNSFIEYSVSDEALARKAERMQRGVDTLMKIRVQFPAAHLVICPNNALGDVYWAMSFLPAYQKMHGIINTVVAVAGDACYQVSEMFGAANIIKLESGEMDEFVSTVIFTREDNCIIAHHDRPYTDKIIKLLDKHFLSFIDYYKYAVYGLPPDAAPVAPTIFAAFDNHAGIKQGKSVILSPYAKSVVELPMSFWKETAIEYLEKGYSVYTNVIGSEKPVHGTLPISIPIPQIKAAVEYAGTFIGIRNGLCDVLTTAVCRKIVVFPDCYYSTTPYKVSEFFDLPGWEND